MVVGLLVLFANPAHAEHQDFVGHEPARCDILAFEGPLEGTIIGTSLSISSEIRATFNQFGCQITAELETMSSRFTGSGTSHTLACDVYPSDLSPVYSAGTNFMDRELMQ